VVKVSRQKIEWWMSQWWLGEGGNGELMFETSASWRKQKGSGDRWW
jgi:hypothetical protein